MLHLDHGGSFLPHLKFYCLLACLLACLLCWVFVAAQAVSGRAERGSLVATRGLPAVPPPRGAQALGSGPPARPEAEAQALWSAGVVAPEHVGPPGPGVRPASLALAGGFFATESPRKSGSLFLK